MNILVVEDEEKTASFLKKGLTEQGYNVDVHLRGDEGLEAALKQNYSAMIMDVMLPGIDGWEMMKIIRNKQIETPILFLTARDSIEDRVQGLRLGADDYLIKPFAFSELLARLETIVQRKKLTPVDSMKFEDIEVHLSTQKAFRQGQELSLSPKELQLLVFFISHPGIVFQKKVLAEKVWGLNFDFDTNIVEVSIRRLRQKIDDAYATKLIHTIRGIGNVLKVES